MGLTAAASLEELILFYQHTYSSLELVGIYQQLHDRIKYLSSLRVVSREQEEEVEDIQQELDAIYLALPLTERKNISKS